jgi:hypothetical protein
LSFLGALVVFASSSCSSAIHLRPSTCRIRKRVWRSWHVRVRGAGAVWDGALPRRMAFVFGLRVLKRGRRYQNWIPTIRSPECVRACVRAGEGGGGGGRSSAARAIASSATAFCRSFCHGNRQRHATCNAPEDAPDLAGRSAMGNRKDGRRHARQRVADYDTRAQAWTHSLRKHTQRNAHATHTRARNSTRARTTHATNASRNRLQHPNPIGC